MSAYQEAFASSTYLLSQIPGLGRSSDDDFVLSLSNPTSNQCRHTKRPLRPPRICSRKYPDSAGRLMTTSCSRSQTEPRTNVSITRGTALGVSFQFTLKAQPTFNTGRALYVKLFFFAGGLETLCVLGYLELVYTLLDIAIHECRKIIHRPVDTMIGHTGLRIVICTNLR